MDSDIQVIGSDETATNTGVHSEIIQRLEVAPSKSVHWAICGLHFNELPFHAVFKTLDGDANLPRGFKGPIEKQLPKTFKAKVLKCSSQLLWRCLFYRNQYFIDTIKVNIIFYRPASVKPLRGHWINHWLQTNIPRLNGKKLSFKWNCYKEKAFVASMKTKNLIFSR